MTAVSEDELTRLDELDAAATPGPWRSSPHSRGNPSDGPTLHTIHSVSDSDDERCRHQVAETEYDEMGFHDAELIAFARDALPRLVAEVRAHRAREAADVPTEEMVEVGARAVNGLDWTQTEFGEVPHERDIARAVLLAVLSPSEDQTEGSKTDA